MDWFKPILDNTTTQGLNMYSQLRSNYGLPLTSLLALLQAHNSPEGARQKPELPMLSETSLNQKGVTGASVSSFGQKKADLSGHYRRERRRLKTDLKVTFDDSCQKIEEAGVKKPIQEKRTLDTSGLASLNDGQPTTNNGSLFSASLNVRHMIRTDNWYQQHLMNRRLGPSDSLHHLSWQRKESYIFPDSSYESSSDHNEGEGQRLVLCQQVRLNERRISPKPFVAVPHPASTRVFKNIKTDSARGVESPDSEAGNRHSAPGGGAISKHVHVQDDLYGVAQSRISRRKTTVLARARSKRAIRSQGKKRKKVKENALVVTNPEEDSTFSEVSPWNSFSCASPVDKSDNGSTITAIGGVFQGTKKEVKRPKLKRKPLVTVKKKAVNDKTKKYKRIVAETVQIMDSSVQTSLSANKFQSDKIGDEIFGRLPDSPSQRLKNIACCRALPAPPPESTEKLPHIARSKCDEEPVAGEIATPMDPVAQFQSISGTPKSKFTTFIEAVRIVEREKGRKMSNSLRLDPPWIGSETVFQSKSSRLPWTSRQSSRHSSRPSSAINSANNAMSSTKPANYDPVELLRRFRENLGTTRGKGLGATARTETPRPRKPNAIQSIIHSLQKKRRQCTLVPIVSCISHDNELAFFKNPSCVKKKQGAISKQKSSVAREAGKIRQPQKKKTRNIKMKKPRSNQIIKKKIYL
ncbi:hypothetical protein BgiBS90_020694 [Biomphalaria glabrata]|nr:hypothetical protein BgiBS90_020694 [Biomphalaria glabrata]